MKGADQRGERGEAERLARDPYGGYHLSDPRLWNLPSRHESTPGQGQESTVEDNRFESRRTAARAGPSPKPDRRSTLVIFY